MNIDIKSLNEEEFRKLCESIGANAFKKLYEKFPEDFSKICPGFRAKNLKADKAIDLAVKNRSKKFILNFVHVHSKKAMDDSFRSTSKKIADLEREIEEKNSVITKLENSLESLTNELNVLRSENEQEEMSLLSASDLSNGVISTSEEYPYTSLCQVQGFSKNGASILKRLADIDDNEICLPFNPDSPNYEILYNKDSKVGENFVGIWGWRTEPNRNPEKREFIVSKLYIEQPPIEIILLQDCTSETDLKLHLLEGIECDLLSGKALISYYTEHDTYCGFLCSEKSFESVGMKKKIKVLALGLFEVGVQSTISFGEKIFYSRLNLGTAKKIVRMKDLRNFIREKIISRAVWSSFKNRVAKKDLATFREFLSNFTTEEFYDELAREYFCPVEEIRSKIDNFIEEADKYFQTETFDDSILSGVIENCSRLFEKCQLIATEKWRTDNEQIINQMENKISTLKHNLEEQHKINKELEQEIVDKQNTLDKIMVDIESKKQLASEVEIKIAQKVESAKTNVADFICEMAFINAQAGGIQLAQAITENKNYRLGQMIESEDVEENKTLEYFIGTLESELGLQGVSNQYVLSFAAYLCAAYKNKILLLLAGPNGRDIADAFSVALNGKTAGVFDCANVSSFRDLNICRDSEDEVIVVLNPFAPNFIAYLPELINIESKFIFAVYPFAEDLKIEPHGLYNYFLPLLTELIIDKRPARDFTIKYSSDKIKAELKENYTPDAVPISVEKRIKKLVRDTEKILSTWFSRDFDCQDLITKFPLAYVKGNGEKFLEEFKGDEKVSEKIRDFLEGVQ